jgi:SAM-dependent MidA family methyltransferase
MREAFDGWTYISVDVGDEPPAARDAIVFANELFDALPVRAYCGGEEALVDFRGGRFVWTRQPDREERPASAATLRAMSSAVRSGAAVLIDYGYVESERARRFPEGSLLSYRSHSALRDVLRSPGERDITSHVDWTEIERISAQTGWRKRWRKGLRAFLLEAGEDAVAAVARDRAGQLKTLLFSFGESFGVLWLDRGGPGNIGSK